MGEDERVSGGGERGAADAAPAQGAALPLRVTCKLTGARPGQLNTLQ